MEGIGSFTGMVGDSSITGAKPLNIIPVIPLNGQNLAPAVIQYEDKRQASKAFAEEILRRVQDRIYPMYAFFLYSSKDKDLAEFVRVDGHWLNSLSGFTCLIGVLENPGEWEEGWELYWKDALGPRFKKLKKEWMNLKPYDRDVAFQLADLLNVDKSTLPCMVFFEYLPSTDILCIPIINDKTKYQKYFQDIFAAVSSASKGPAGERLKVLQSEWRKLWCKWILPPWIKDMLESVQEWGSLIAKTKSVIIDVVDPISPILENLVKNPLV